MTNVEETVKNDLCTSCGICKSVCPKNCIDFIRYAGQYVPKVDKESCIKCGICLNICPGIKLDLTKMYTRGNLQSPENYYIGNYIACFVANAKNNKVRNDGVSGGCITAIVKELLNIGKYDVAFLVDSYDYNNYLETYPYNKDDSLTATTKSRYVPISHYKAARYMLENKEKRLIFVATSCAVQGLLNLISMHKLDRDNYLILGLFCDKVLNYNIFDYFKDYGRPKSKLKNLFFRTKEKDGWPGQVKLEYENGDVKFLPAKERMILKEYFQLERCLYCIDKLNQFADISFGDNYTEKNKSREGSNSIIVRTSIGISIWESVENVVESSRITMEDIYNSQHIEGRLVNYEFARIKSIHSKIQIYPNSPIMDSFKTDLASSMENKLELINKGRNYQKNKLYFHTRTKCMHLHDFIIRVKRRLNNMLKVSQLKRF